MEMIEQRGLAVPFPIEVRTVAPDDAFLSTAAGPRQRLRGGAHVRGHGVASRTSAPSRRSWPSSSGRPHWGKRHFQTAATLRPRYPDWDRFQAVRARLDPHGRFANAWTDRVLGAGRAQRHERGRC